MDVGILHPGVPGMGLRDTARWIEGCGFDSLWFGDHVLSYLDGLAAVAIAGAATARLRVGTAVAVAQWRPPPLLARGVATIAAELGDRMVLGLGVGGDVPAELEVLGLDRSQRGQATDRAIEVLREALEGGRLGGHPFLDRPKGGCPAIWIGGRSAAAAIRAGRTGEGLIPYLTTIDQTVALGAAARSARAATGRPADGLTLSPLVLVSAHSDPASAWRQASDHRPYRLDDDRLRRFLVWGTPERCAEQLTELATRAGCQGVILQVPSAPPVERRDHVERLAAIVSLLATQPAAGARRVLPERHE